jgi:hypothetical protein
MALSIESWLLILSNIMSLWTNIICDIIENPNSEMNQAIFRECYRSCLRGSQV